jgi:hypothetical protein
MSREFPNKLVAVLNEKIEPGVIMNALAHISLAFGAEMGKETMHVIDYVDAEGGKHPSSKMPFIILKGNSNKIRELRESALALQMQCADFINTMTGGTYQEQLERSKQTKDIDLTYYGIVLFGEWDKVSELTRKFSLWK